MAPAPYLTRSDGGRYYLQIRLGKAVAALYGRKFLRASLRTTDDAEARRRLVDNLGWACELIDVPDLEALGRVIYTRLLAHPDIAMAALVGEPDTQLGERVVAHVVSRNVELTAVAIIDYCATTGLLSNRKIPKAIHFHDRLPTGPTNKLYRQALRQKKEDSNAQ